jgi:hypothetical protein
MIKSGLPEYKAAGLRKRLPIFRIFLTNMLNPAKSLLYLWLFETCILNNTLLARVIP